MGKGEGRIRMSKIEVREGREDKDKENGRREIMNGE